MGALGGISTWQGGIDPESLTAMGEHLAPFGPDGDSLACGDRWGMVLRAFRTSTRTETGQRIFQHGPWAAGIAGRLDNEAALAETLGQHPNLSGHYTGESLAVAAVEKWGVEGLARLVGDFALALWDSQGERLILACDAIGLRPIYYRLEGDGVTWSTRVRCLAGGSAASMDLDETYFASFLTRSRPMGRSPFRKIRSVPPGHALVVQRSGVQLERYHRFEPDATLRYRSDREYEEHFRELFREAVRCRMATEGPIFADLSGGLDSSSIVCMADEILPAGDAEAQSLTTVSYVYREAHSSDERAFSTLVEKQRGQAGLHIFNEEHPLLAPVPDGVQPDVPTAQVAYQSRHEFLAEEMDSVGARVLLRGMAGDQVLWGEAGSYPFEVGDLLSQWRVIAALRAAHRWSRALRMPWHRSFFRGGIWPFLPRRWQAASSRLGTLAPWFAESFARRSDLPDLSLGPQDDVGFPLPSTRDQYTSIRQVAQEVGSDLCLDGRHVEVRFPFLDRRLVEFALAIPLEQLLRFTETRSLLRRSLRGSLPDPIRLRRTKSGPDEAIYRTLASEAPRLTDFFVQGEVCKRGLVDPRRITEALERGRHGLTLSTPQLLRTYALEVWLRSLTHPHTRGQPSVADRSFHVAAISAAIPS